MTGIRTAAINIFATATIASFVGLSDLGDLVTGRNVYGDDGVVAGAIVIAVLAGLIELVLAGVQRLVTPRGVKLQRAARSRIGFRDWAESDVPSKRKGIGSDERSSTARRVRAVACRASWRSAIAACGGSSSTSESSTSASATATT